MFVSNHSSPLYYYMYRFVLLHKGAGPGEIEGVTLQSDVSGSVGAEKGHAALVIVVKQQPFVPVNMGPNSMQITCPYCHQNVKTKSRTEWGQTNGPSVYSFWSSGARTLHKLYLLMLLSLISLLVMGQTDSERFPLHLIYWTSYSSFATSSR